MPSNYPPGVSGSEPQIAGLTRAEQMDKPTSTWVVVDDDSAYGPFTMAQLAVWCREDLLSVAEDDDELADYRAMDDESIIREHLDSTESQLVELHQPEADWPGWKAGSA